MKFRNILFIAIGLILVLLVVRKIMTSGKDVAVNPAAAKSQQLLVSAYVVKPQNISDKITASGTIMANEQADVKNEIAGRVIHIYFQEGKKVKKGEMLVKIFDSDLQAQLKKLQL